MNKEKCRECDKVAVWFYLPGMEDIYDREDDYYCEDHVSRGCTCNLSPKDGGYENLDPENWAEDLDDQGRKFPCCEYMYSEEGWYKDE